MSVSGIFINHTSEFSLDKTYLKSPWLLKHLYGVKPTQGRSIQINGQSFILTRQSVSRLNTELLAGCEQELIGVQYLKFEAVAVICQTKVSLYSWPDFYLIERLDEVAGLHLPIENVSTETCLSDVCYQSNGQWFEYDVNQLSSQAIAQQVKFNRNHLPQLSIYPQTISLERLILDLHSGAIFSTNGKLLVDLFAILLIILSCFGGYLWLHAFSIKKKRNKSKS